MPKYIQNKMINLFDDSDDYFILFGTNSISEGINKVMKDLFILPENDTKDELLLKNTIGRAGRLGKHPIGHIYSTKNLELIFDEDVTISLAISNDDLFEIIDSKDLSKMKVLSDEYSLDIEFIQYLIDKYKFQFEEFVKF